MRKIFLIRASALAIALFALPSLASAQCGAAQASAPMAWLPPDMRSSSVSYTFGAAVTYTHSRTSAPRRFPFLGLARRTRLGLLGACQ